MTLSGFQRIMVIALCLFRLDNVIVSIYVQKNELGLAHNRNRNTRVLLVVIKLLIRS